MTKFEKKANELGLDVNNLSKALNKDVNEYYEGIGELKNLKESLASATNEEEQGINDEISELSEVLNDFDDLLVEKIEKYSLNKVSYDDKVRKMSEGRERAKQAKLQGQPQPQPQPQPQAKVEPQVQPKIEEETTKEEKSDWGWLIFAGVVGAITLGAVMLRKK